MPITHKRRLATFITLFTLLAIAVTWHFLRLREPEPTYKGKPLGFWLKGYDPQNKIAGSEWQEADEAIRHTGTNAIPALLRMLKAKDSAPMLKMIDLMDRQHVVKNPFTRASDLNNRASRGLQRLGIDATNAVPALVEIFNQGISTPSANGAAFALGVMGPAAKSAVPSLLSAARDQNPERRTLAIYALGQICAEPETVVPVITTALHDPDVNVRRMAVVALGLYEKSARPAIPALMQSLNDPDYEIRRFALYSLQAIDPAAAKKARADEYKR
jgi:HEAT repeat protein